MKPDRIEQVMRTLRVRSTPARHQKTLEDIRAAHDRLRQSQAATPSRRVVSRWATKLAIAASVAVMVTYVAVTHRSPRPVSPPWDMTEITQSPAELTTACSLGKAFRQGGLEGVERQLDRAFERVGPWPANPLTRDPFDTETKWERSTI